MDESIDEKQSGKSFLRRRTMKPEQPKTGLKKVAKRIDCWLDNAPKVTSSLTTNKLISNEEMDEEEKHIYLERKKMCSINSVHQEREGA